MSIETRSSASPATATIHAGSTPARGYEAGARTNFMTSRPAERGGIQIRFPQAGERSPFMSISRHADRPASRITIDRPRTGFTNDRGFQKTLESKQIKSGDIRELVTAPSTEAARRGDKSFAEAMKEKQTKQDQAQTRVSNVREELQGTYPPKIEIKDRPTSRPEIATIQREPEARPLIDIPKSATPVKRETHAFYSPTAKPEMTSRVSAEPQKKERTASQERIRKEAGPSMRLQPETQAREGALRLIKPDQTSQVRKDTPSKDEALETLKTYAKTPKPERKVTPEIKQAFGKVIQEAKLSLINTIATVWQEKGAQASVPGVDSEAVEYLRGILDKYPDLKRKVEAQLAIATTVLANYAVVGYPIVLASAAVLRVLEGVIRTEVRKVLKPDPKLDFPNSDGEDGDDGGDPKPDPEKKEETEREEEEEITFQRAEGVNSIRVKELLQLADMMGEENEEKVKIISPKTVAQVWKLTTVNVSPIIKDDGAQQRRVDGSWDEIVKEMEGWSPMSLSEFSQQVNELVAVKTAVAKGANPYATEEDITRVLTVPLEYSTLRMNKQQHEYPQAA